MITTHVKRRVTVIHLKGIRVTQDDIDGAKCRLTNQCMVRVATERYLRAIDPSEYNHHTKVDAGHIRFNKDGFHFSGDTPKVPKWALLQWDKEEKARAKAEKLGVPFVSEVKPFTFSMFATRGTKVEHMSRERQVHINEARKRREATGKKDNRYSFRKRVVGFA